jgi:hypothetical protein
MGLALCIRGTQGKGTLGMYPSLRVPTLVVDNFAIKIMSEDIPNHIINTLKKYYTITVDREATKYIGLTINWDYEDSKVNMYMLGYLSRAMMLF